MVRVAENCLRKNPDKRFSMKKVVYALTYLTNRVTVSGIEDFFPSKSYYASVLPQSSSWQNDGRMVEQESDATEIPSGSGTSDISELFPSASSTQTISTRSPTTSVSSQRSSLSDIFSSASSAQTFSTADTSASSQRSSSLSEKNDRREKAKSRSRIQVPYGEMLH
ncbi:hypothetical protein MKW98_027997 [Papaver atlanticum]|uniref:Uncharacterized protein n=1 Tax=Papaver atlanticum TaxID=357466 RepID=A0AAD4XRP0_9MAGN|nr:hypothetical protein MKW98_027997 [Papaver atlanticum]